MFDGAPLPSKLNTENKRSKLRKENYLNALKSLEGNDLRKAK